MKKFTQNFILLAQLQLISIVPKTYDDVCVWKDLCKFSLQKEINKGFKKIMIFNLDKHTGPGTHWTSFIDVTDKFIFYLIVQVIPFLQKLKN